MVTLEISSTDIRLMEIEGGRVITWASLPVDPSMFEEGVISDPQALSEVIKQLMTASGINGRNVTVSVSGLYSVSRIVTVPTPLGVSASREAILEEVRGVMPFSEDELYISWQTLATGEGGQQVVVVGVPRDVIDAEVQALRAAGLNPRILDLKGMALARAVNRDQALILNIEPTSFDVIMVVGGISEIMRTAAWQPGDLSVEDKAEQLAVALELTVGFYNSHHPGFPFDPATPLFITGQMSGDLALMEKLQARAEYSIESLAPPLKYPEHLPVSQYAVNMGLALKGTALPKDLGQGGYSLPDINLLPEVYKPWKPSPRQIQVFCGIVVAMVLLFPLYQLTSETIGKTADLRVRYNALYSVLERKQAEIRSREPLQKAINDYHTIVDMGGGFTENLRIINSKAEEVGVEVETISHESSRITVVCQADSYATFREYLVALEESGRFFTPIPPPEGYPYTKAGAISLKPKPPEPTEAAEAGE